MSTNAMEMKSRCPVLAAREERGLRLPRARRRPSRRVISASSRVCPAMAAIPAVRLLLTSSLSFLSPISIITFILSLLLSILFSSEMRPSEMPLHLRQVPSPNSSCWPRPQPAPALVHPLLLLRSPPKRRRFLVLLLLFTHPDPHVPAAPRGRLHPRPTASCV